LEYLPRHAKFAGVIDDQLYDALLAIIANVMEVIPAHKGHVARDMVIIGVRLNEAVEGLCVKLLSRLCIIHSTPLKFNEDVILEQIHYIFIISGTATYDEWDIHVFDCLLNGIV